LTEPPRPKAAPAEARAEEDPNPLGVGAAAEAEERVAMSSKPRQSLFVDTQKSKDVTRDAGEGRHELRDTAVKFKIDYSNE